METIKEESVDSEHVLLTRHTDNTNVSFFQ